MKDDLELILPGSKKGGCLIMGRGCLRAMFSEDPVKSGLAKVLVCIQLHVYFKEADVCKEGKRVIHCHVGEWITSSREIAQQTKLERHSVGKILNDLMGVGVLNVKKVWKYQRIKLINYESLLFHASRREGSETGKAVPVENREMGASLFDEAASLYTDVAEEGGML